MKKKKLIILTIIFGVICLMSFLKKETHFYNEENKDITVRIKNKNGNIESMDLESYVIGVVAAEMPALYEKEALKAQAIASRTYALYKIENNNNNYDLVSDVSNQAYINVEQMKDKWKSDFEKYYTKISEIVNDTKGLVMKNNGKVICAYYFAISNGVTEDSVTVFKSNLDYIESVNSDVDKNVRNYEMTISVAKEDFCKSLSISCDNIVISNVSRSSTNHVDTITINNILFSGLEIRKLLSLRSTDFDIEVNDKVYITTRGYGHGVGMSQSGANELSKLGKNYVDILNYYYKNITIEKYSV